MKKSAVTTESLKSTIRGAGLRSTSPRLVVLRRLFAAATPISHSELFEGLADEGLDRTTVYLTDAEVRVTDAEGKVTLTPRKAGDVVPGGAAKHREENTTGKPVEALMVELK